MHQKIYLSPPHLNEEEWEQIAQALASNWIAPAGPHLDLFEKAICEATGAGYALALNSGTAALHLALLLLDIQLGDEVLCQSFTFVASANPVTYLKATPVFIDSESDTWNISPVYLEQAICAGIKKKKKPKALILTHLYGNCARMKEVMEITQHYQIPVIEDAAESLGSFYQNRHTGTFGEMGILSFNGNKIVTTSAGGALISHREAYRSKGLFFSTQAKEETAHYEHRQTGYNYRLSNLLAALGAGQMQSLSERIQKKREIYTYYRENLSDYPEIGFTEELPGSFYNRWLTCIQTPSFPYREKIRLNLALQNIESRPLWKPLHLQPLFKGCAYFGEKTAEHLFEKGLCLPSGVGLEEEDLKRIVEIIAEQF